MVASIIRRRHYFKPLLYTGSTEVNLVNNYSVFKVTVTNWGLTPSKAAASHCTDMTDNTFACDARSTRLQYPETPPTLHWRPPAPAVIYAHRNQPDLPKIKISREQLTGGLDNIEGSKRDNQISGHNFTLILSSALNKLRMDGIDVLSLFWVLLQR